MCTHLQHTNFDGGHLMQTENRKKIGNKGSNMTGDQKFNLIKVAIIATAVASVAWAISLAVFP